MPKLEQILIESNYQLPIESEMKNHYIIPGFPEYYLTPEGKLYSQYRKRYISSYKRLRYATIVLKSQKNGTLRMGAHRLMMLIFKYPGPRCLELQVNHINGNVFDNRLDNLEWCTASENSQHAIDNKLNVYQPIEVLVRDITTGDVITYPSIGETSRQLNTSRDLVQYYSNTNGKLIFRKKYQLQYKNRFKSWPEDPREPGTTKPILVKAFLEDGKIYRFRSQKEASLFIGLSEGALSEALNDKTQPMLVNLHLAIYEGSGDFRTVEDPYVDYICRSEVLKPVYVYNINTRKSQVFETSAECADHFGILRTTLCWRLKSKFSGKAVYNGYTFQYFNGYDNLITPK